MQNRPLILVVDDESKIRRLVADNLEFEGFDTMCASDGARALELLVKSPEKPDLIVLDLMMPEMDGLELLHRLRRFSSVPVIILSAKDENPTVIEGFRLGADDFIAKPFSVQELVERVKAVLRRTNKFRFSASPNETVLFSGALELNVSQRQCLVQGNPVKLTDTEFKLLHKLMKHPGEVVPHEVLLRLVWGEEYLGEVQYLRVNFARIRRKLEQSGLKGTVISSYSSVGYMLNQEE